MAPPPSLPPPLPRQPPSPSLSTLWLGPPTSPPPVPAPRRLRSGKTYYYNRYTRESRWTRPGAVVERQDSQGDELMRARRSPTNAGSSPTQVCSPDDKVDRKGYFKAQ